MKKEIFELIKKESKPLAIAFALVFAVIKIAFFRENFYSSLRILIAAGYMFLLPGYFIMIYWHEKIRFAERLAIGSLISAGSLGILSYYFGVLGINLKYHYIILPLALIALGCFMSRNRTTK